jgi:hypothetical protein
LFHIFFILNIQLKYQEKSLWFIIEIHGATRLEKQCALSGQGLTFWYRPKK